MRKKNKQTNKQYIYMYTYTFYILCLNILSIKLKMHLSFYILIRKYFCLDICICLEQNTSILLRTTVYCLLKKKNIIMQYSIYSTAVSLVLFLLQQYTIIVFINNVNQLFSYFQFKILNCRNFICFFHQHYYYY